MTTFLTLTVDDLPAGTIIFNVHDDRGIVPGQILSIGSKGKDMEHVQAKAKGSVHLLVATVNAHARGSPVRLITASLRGQQTLSEVIQTRSQHAADAGAPGAAISPHTHHIVQGILI